MSGLTGNQREHRTRFFVAGYFGFGNVGDEAVLATLLSDLRDIRPEADVVVTSERPEQTRRMHGVAAVSWRSLSEVIETMQQADHFIVGGGGLYNSYFDYGPTELLRQTDNYAQHIYDMPILARMLAVPSTIFSVGGGRIVGSFPRSQAALSLACASTVVVRDSVSAAFFRELGLASEAVHRAADPAFRLPEIDLGKVDGFFRDSLIWCERERPVLVVVRHWLDLPERFIDDFAAALTNLARYLRRAVLFIPFDCDLHSGDLLSDDADMIDRMSSRLPDDVPHRVFVGDHHPSLVSRLFAATSAVVSMRLHGCILAVRHAVPLVAVAYDPKVRAVLEDIDLHDAIINPTAVREPLSLQRIAEPFLTAAGQVRLRRARDRAQELSASVRSHLERSIAKAELTPLPDELRRLQEDLTRRFVRARAAYDQHPEPMMATLRTAVNTGEAGLGFALATAVCAFDNQRAEAYYLRGTTREALRPGRATSLADLDEAVALGFSLDWVEFVKACIFVASGERERAMELLGRLEARAPDHPGLDALKVSLSAVR